MVTTTTSDMDSFHFEMPTTTDASASMTAPLVCISPARPLGGFEDDDGEELCHYSPPGAPMKKPKPSMQSRSTAWNSTRKELFAKMREGRVNAEHSQ